MSRNGPPIAATWVATSAGPPPATIKTTANMLARPATKADNTRTRRVVRNVIGEVLSEFASKTERDTRRNGLEEHGAAVIRPQRKRAREQNADNRRRRDNE